MRKRALAVALSLCIVYAPTLAYAAGPVGGGFAVALPQDQDQGEFQPYTPEQLDNLLAPIALYPDPLLAQVLPAATFPDQIDQAEQYVRGYGQEGVDDQPWDVSVKAVAHYPTVLQMMDEKLDWTTAVGQAYVYQSTDVTEAIQRLRHMAYSRRNLRTGSQQEVVVEGDYIQIVPVQPRYIFVPVYDPGVVFIRPAVFGVAAISFGAGFVIGAWLNRDWNWGGGGIYYTGWQGGGWIARSRPVVQVNNNVYVNNTYQNVTVNRTVINRQVNVTNINNYNSVHNNVTYNNVVNNNNTNIHNGNTYNRNGTNNTFNRNGSANNPNATFRRNPNGQFNRPANPGNNTFNRNGSTNNPTNPNGTFRRNPNGQFNRPGNPGNNTFNRNGSTNNPTNPNATFRRNPNGQFNRPGNGNPGQMNPRGGQSRPNQGQARPGGSPNKPPQGQKGENRNKGEGKPHPGPGM